MLLSWFDTSEVDAFAESLAGEFTQRMPKEGEVRGASGRAKEATATLLARVERFARGHKLNLFKRARLANSLKWKLQEAGYDRSTVDALTLDVAKIASLTRYVGSRPGSADRR